MATIKGQNLRVLFDQHDPEVVNPCVAGSTSCTLHVSAIVQEDMTKDTVDDFIINEVTGLEWDVQVDALVLTPQQSTSGIGLEELEVGLSYDLIFTRTEGTMNREQVSNNVTFSGTAILEDLQINAPNQDESSYTARFRGYGDLQMTVPEPANEE